MHHELLDFKCNLKPCLNNKGCKVCQKHGQRLGGKSNIVSKPLFMNLPGSSDLQVSDVFGVKEEGYNKDRTTGS